VGGFITIVGVGQALLFGGRKPRLASMVSGAAISLLLSMALWVFPPRLMPREYLMIMMVWYLIVGGLLGYVAGVLVGGVFLVADYVRRLFERQSKSAPDGPPDSNPSQDLSLRTHHERLEPL
jgi:hypothetical protein